MMMMNGKMKIIMKCQIINIVNNKQIKDKSKPKPNQNLLLLLTDIPPSKSHPNLNPFLDSNIKSELPSKSRLKLEAKPKSDIHPFFLSLMKPKT